MNKIKEYINAVDALNISQVEAWIESCKLINPKDASWLYCEFCNHKSMKENTA